MPSGDALSAPHRQWQRSRLRPQPAVISRPTPVRPSTSATTYLLVVLLYLTMIAIDVIRKVTGISGNSISVVYVITILIYIKFFLLRVSPTRKVPRYLSISLVLLSLWCLIEAVVQRIPPEMALLGWASYVFFVPLVYIGADLTADQRRAEKALRLVAIAGALIGLGAIASALLGQSAPTPLQPIIPAVGFHSFNGGNIYLAPSIFATAEEAAEHLLVALFAWAALAQMRWSRLRYSTLAILGVLIIGGLIATARRADIIVAVAGILTLVAVNNVFSSKATQLRPRSASRANGRLSAGLLLAITCSIATVFLLGADKLTTFLASGSPGSRLSLMFSSTNPDSLIGQGTGTSTQGADLLGATSFYSYVGQKVYISYLINGRLFITAEGGLTKTWLELGLVGVILYAAVFLCVLGPALSSVRHLDNVGRTLIVLTLALGIIFLKGHQSLDDPLVQPLFWLAAGGVWGRLRPQVQELQRMPEATQGTADVSA